MYDTFKRFADQKLFSVAYADPYLQSHPMPADRLAALAEVGASTSPYWDKKDPPELQTAPRSRCAPSFSAIWIGPIPCLRRYPLSDNSLPARYARAVSTYRHADLRAALAQIDGLIQSQPNNPYFYELKGQALVEAGRAREAIAPLRHAISLAPDPDPDPRAARPGAGRHQRPPPARRSDRDLRNALATDPEIPDAYDQLAMAYGRKDDLADADLASAQAAFARGDLPTARQLAQSRQGAFSDRIAGLGQGRRHRKPTSRRPKTSYPDADRRSQRGTMTMIAT